MNLLYSGISDIGLKRAVNQDSILMGTDADKKIYLFVVADGMGGHSNGELASRAITEGLQDWLEKFSESVYENDFSRIMTALRNKLEEINAYIFDKYNQTEVCGSTCIVLAVYNDVYGVLSVGDSHIYLKRGFHIKTLTEDDVWENQASVRESARAEDIESHPNYGKLIHAVGTDRELAISVMTDILKKKDTFLLCSDGLYKFCSGKQIMRALKKVNNQNIDIILKEMIHFVYENEAKDNISVILVKNVKEM